MCFLPTDMPRSFLIKKQSDQMEDIHAMSVQQEESCETGTSATVFDYISTCII